MTADRTRRRWLTWTIGVGSIVAAWFVALVTPGAEVAQAPFIVPAVIGEQATGRNISATISDVRRADRVAESDGAWSADGNWLVFDLEIASVVTERGGLLAHAMVEIDGVRYNASERPDTIAGTPLSAGIPRQGSIAFELPGDLEAGGGSRELAMNGDTRLDSMIVLPFDLAEVPHVAEAELVETGWARP